MYHQSRQRQVTKRVPPAVATVDFLASVQERFGKNAVTTPLRKIRLDSKLSIEQANQLMLEIEVCNRRRTL